VGRLGARHRTGPFDKGRGVQAAAVTNWMVTLFHVAGVAVRVHASWLVIFGLIAWSLSVGYFPHVLPDFPLLTYWANGLVAALLLFASVLVHEVSHSLAARGFGIPVRSITLHIFGGLAQIAREPHRPGVEFVVAVVGPLTSVLVAVVVALAGRLVEPGAAASAVMQYLVLMNVALAVFNLVPGFGCSAPRYGRLGAIWFGRPGSRAAPARPSRSS
jgi:Zn-dependent protease